MKESCALQKLSISPAPKAWVHMDSSDSPPPPHTIHQSVSPPSTHSPLSGPQVPHTAPMAAPGPWERPDKGPGRADGQGGMGQPTATWGLAFLEVSLLQIGAFHPPWQSWSPRSEGGLVLGFWHREKRVLRWMVAFLRGQEIQRQWLLLPGELGRSSNSLPNISMGKQALGTRLF